MRWRYILNTVGVLILFFGGTMVVPLAFDLFAMDRSLLPLIKAMGVTLVCGAALVALFRHEKTETMSQREGMAIVAVGWTAIGLFGALPFYFSDASFFFVDAFLSPFPGLPPPVHRF
jgi:trk system potassium uptake protein TrkH